MNPTKPQEIRMPAPSASVVFKLDESDSGTVKPLENPAVYSSGSTYFNDGFRDGNAGETEAPPHHENTDVFANEYREGYRVGELRRKMREPTVAQCIEETTTRPLRKEEALRKGEHFSDSRIGGAGAPIERQMTGLVQAGATEESLKQFWREVKHISWPENWGQTPWDVAAMLGAALEARDLGPAFNAIGIRYVEPFRAAYAEAR